MSPFGSGLPRPRRRKPTESNPKLQYKGGTDRGLILHVYIASRSDPRIMGKIKGVLSLREDLRYPS